MVVPIRWQHVLQGVRGTPGKAACGSSACKAGDRERAVGFIFLKARAVALHSVFRRHTATHPPANSS